LAGGGCRYPRHRFSQAGSNRTWRIRVLACAE
jgi:hypothetical protein